MAIPTGYAGTLLSLKDSVYYVVLVDPTTKNALGKVIDSSRNHHFKPNNSTAAHILYLLSVVLKYGISVSDAERELTTFLDKLTECYTVTVGGRTITSGILDVSTTGDVTDSPDPCGLFNTPASWEADPEIVMGAAPIKRGERHYGCGNTAYTIRK